MRGSRATLSALAAAWALAVLTGVYFLTRYASTPGVPGAAEATWPTDSAIPHAAGRDTLVVFAHPGCPCTRATLHELARIVDREHDRITASVVIMSAGTDEDDGELAAIARRIPGVTVVGDPSGVETARFRAVTSGQTVLYGTDGRLLFQGGITAARAHEGENPGSDRVMALVEHGTSDLPTSPVFGCALGTSVDSKTEVVTR